MSQHRHISTRFSLFRFLSIAPYCSFFPHVSSQAVSSALQTSPLPLLFLSGPLAQFFGATGVVDIPIRTPVPVNVEIISSADDAVYLCTLTGLGSVSMKRSLGLQCGSTTDSLPFDADSWLDSNQTDASSFLYVQKIDPSHRLTVSPSHRLFAQVKIAFV
jgi:hypothetical protein